MSHRIARSLQGLLRLQGLDVKAYTRQSPEPGAYSSICFQTPDGLTSPIQVLLVTDTMASLVHEHIDGDTVAQVPLGRLRPQSDLVALDEAVARSMELHPVQVSKQGSDGKLAG